MSLLHGKDTVVLAEVETLIEQDGYARYNDLFRQMINKPIQHRTKNTTVPINSKGNLILNTENADARSTTSARQKS